MKFHITVEETTRTIYEVEASTEREARQKFTNDGGKFVGSETDLQSITEVEIAEDA